MSRPTSGSPQQPAVPAPPPSFVAQQQPSRDEGGTSPASQSAPLRAAKSLMAMRTRVTREGSGEIGEYARHLRHDVCDENAMTRNAIRSGAQVDEGDYDLVAQGFPISV